MVTGRIYPTTGTRRQRPNLLQIHSFRVVMTQHITPTNPILINGACALVLLGTGTAQPVIQ
ncbi:hypothetical protein ARGLB_047_00890 [Arthrobacter globiformis NBRC 12137]|uniref:Uncharacterized protein n=1 Tax=Arthrobacter globiformis (strain ATCC 8010 / DSM 20124 / JCM 1332 / NBRC 12137 / NCIMB 8907 / NRRL B-2979 / 168) TaxID=1077972 RepID=H0QLN8_ARTG1|nr:hypothetical protein ARGLB_047_00890 [Arthrobacter globiformis NBRC 12137]